jgi:nicotinamide riboside kinase
MLGMSGGQAPTGPSKIALVGTSCVGKTTIFEHFQQLFRRESAVAFVEEAARQFFADHPAVTDRFSFDAQGQVQALAFRNERAAALKDPVVTFCDRSVFDAPAYVLATGDVQGSEVLFERARVWGDTYTSIVLLDPKGVPFSVDTVRDEDISLREAFHLGFVHLFERYGVAHTLVSGSLQDRISQILRLLVGVETPGLDHT